MGTACVSGALGSSQPLVTVVTSALPRGCRKQPLSLLYPC